MPPFAVILPGAGSSTRFSSSGETAGNKLLQPLRGMPVVGHSLLAFLNRKDVAAVVLAASGEVYDRLPAELRQSAESDPRFHVCGGGSCRAETVRLALAKVPASVEWVAVHDAARPLVSQELIDRVLAAAVEHGAAAPAVPSVATLKEAVGPLPAPVERTLPRGTVWATQTPQIARRADLLHAYTRCPIGLEQITDDAQLLEAAGLGVWLVEGEGRNLKVTMPLDLRVAEAYLQGD